MGRPKQLLPLHEKPFISHCLETILSSGIEDIVVVLGEDGTEIEKLLKGFLSRKRVKTALNADPESGMAESLRIGLGALDASSKAVAVCLCDHPLVLPDTLRTLLALHAKEPDKIVIPSFERKKGHPTLFPRILLERLTGGLTLRDLIHRHPDRVKLAEVPDEGVILDMDTIEDYRMISGIQERKRH
ncbi:MAG: nucleotidyltransferase family protein [Nitrospirae bacterium]|nr:nucleotidyltransferase family protein [Nitrospirota bacterium]